jgi:hypothetical protein
MSAKQKSCAISEEDLIEALDALHGKNRWREPYRTKQGENMLRNDMRMFLEVVEARRQHLSTSGALIMEH